MLKNKVTQNKDFNEKESRRYNVSFRTNHHQDSEKKL